jgi:hypothetical protein
MGFEMKNRSVNEIKRLKISFEKDLIEWKDMIWDGINSNEEIWIEIS